MLNVMLNVMLSDVLFYYPECHAECRVLFIVILNFIMLSVVILNIVMLNVMVPILES